MDRGMIGGLISIRGCVEALCILSFLVSLILFLGRPVVLEGVNAGAFGGFFSGAHNFVIKNFTAVAQGDDFVAKGMKALSEHSMKGAAYDSSLRDPPPQCHPGTRVQLLENIVRWFHDNRREKAILWLNGPAGVGKSAVIQTVAESLARSNSLGATLFFSRLNNRNDPQRVFITVASQLAARIPDYQTYITKQIALDPSLLEKGMNDQFRIFITEPFGNNGIGVGEGPWAVSLDGLDECEGVNEQRRIVRLVSEFVAKFAGASLVWVIASRPEPQITRAFEEEAVAASCWSENMPVDSTQACLDVEHYLDTSFKAMQKQFPHLPSNWPSGPQFLKLSHGALGLFAFARTAVRFMEDPDHAKPESRLDLILSIIDYLDIKAIDDHPFALLDELYTRILSSIPPPVWHDTKRILGFVICTQSGRTEDGISYPLDSSNRALVKVSIILGLKLSDVYGSLHKLYSVLNIPDSGNAHNSEVTFLHASFGDYLADRARSKDFYVDRGESVDDVTRCLFQLYLDKPWQTKWGRYASQLSMIPGPNFYETLKEDAEDSVYYVVTGELSSRRDPFKSQQDRSELLTALGQIGPLDVHNLRIFQKTGICKFLLRLWDEFQEELKGTGLFEIVPLRDLRIEHLDREMNGAVFARATKSSEKSESGTSLFDQMINPGPNRRGVQEHQRLHPERLGMIYGSLAGKRIAFFQGKDNNGYEGYFCFLYPY